MKFVCCLSVLALLLSGCASGPKLYHVKGTVMYQGKPLVRGTIHFDPDPRKGNDGPQAFAMITDGRYDTSEQGGLGVVGGAYIIRIEGFDGVTGPELPYGHKTLKDYEETRDLEKADQEQNFDIPK